MKVMRVKRMGTNSIYAEKLRQLANFSISGSIKGMKKLYYGKGALLVRCGAWIYNATQNPDLYHLHSK